VTKLGVRRRYIPCALAKKEFQVVAVHEKVFRFSSYLLVSKQPKKNILYLPLLIEQVRCKRM